MKKVYLLIVLFLCGLSAGNGFAAAPKQTWADWARSLFPGAGTRRELIVPTDVPPTAVAAAAEIPAADDLGQELIETIARGDIDQVQELLDTGTNANAANRYGYTALMEAAFRGRADIVKLLLDTGADVNATNQDGWTALILAALHGYNDHANTVKLLLDAGADVNAVSPRSEGTALMIEARKGHADTVKLLLDAGTDRAIQNKNGRTAENLARDSGYEKLADYIRAYILSGRLTKYAGKK